MPSTPCMPTAWQAAHWKSTHAMVLRLGREHRIETPVNQMIVALLEAA